MCALLLAVEVLTNCVMLITDVDALRHGSTLGYVQFSTRRVKSLKHTQTSCRPAWRNATALLTLRSRGRTSRPASHFDVRETSHVLQKI
jgi:hypothetical protein